MDYHECDIEQLSKALQSMETICQKENTLIEHIYDELNNVAREWQGAKHLRFINEIELPIKKMEQSQLAIKKYIEALKMSRDDMQRNEDEVKQIINSL